MATDADEAWIDRAHIDILLSEARPTAGELERDPIGTEKQRIAAVEKLRAFYAHPPVPPIVRAFFDLEWLYILKASDPVAASAAFFKGKPRRGRNPARPAEADLLIAIDVQKHIDTGATVEQACEATKPQAREIGSWERIREIYYGTGDAEAKRVWRLLVKAEADRMVNAEIDAASDGDRSD